MKKIFGSFKIVRIFAPCLSEKAQPQRGPWSEHLSQEHESRGGEDSISLVALKPTRDRRCERDPCDKILRNGEVGHLATLIRLSSPVRVWLPLPSRKRQKSKTSRLSGFLCELYETNYGWSPSSDQSTTLTKARQRVRVAFLYTLASLWSHGILSHHNQIDDKQPPWGRYRDGWRPKR